MDIKRRDFLKIGTIASSGIVLKGNALNRELTNTNIPYFENELLRLSFELLQSWCQGLVSLQIGDSNFNEMRGGIICPACSRVHGRIGDAIFPLMFLANKTNNQTYLDSAISIYNWMEQMVNYPDGSWVNDVNVSLWKGITVFGSIALAEALLHHGHILDNTVYSSWENRLGRAADFLYNNFDIKTGNINYTATCSYALSLHGKFLDNKKYTEKGKQLAHQCLKYFTNNKFLYGEGKPMDKISPKGCYHVDLGYNVEESLPALVMYAKLTNDKEVLETVLESLKTHAEFLLPDGAWDNSWGTRNFKWTYWGSRTSDGCQPFALMANESPIFYKVALENTVLLIRCTSDNLLYGGLHNKQHNLSPCIHHTFCHAKALATLLNNEDKVNKLKLPDKIVLPREIDYGVKEFADIQTWLVSKGNWRGTITGYDINFGDKTGGHASGGALTVLWSKEVGPIITASVTHYQLWEANNMQMSKDETFMPLTPRFEMEYDNSKYTNICDFGAKIEYIETKEKIIFNTKAELLDINHKFYLDTRIKCEIDYEFHNDYVIIKGVHNSQENYHLTKYILPIISSNDEEYQVLSNRKIQISRQGKQIILESNSPIKFLKSKMGRIFHFVPGFEALPLVIHDNNFEIKISVV